MHAPEVRPDHHREPLALPDSRQAESRMGGRATSRTLRGIKDGSHPTAARRTIFRTGTGAAGLRTGAENDSRRTGRHVRSSARSHPHAGEYDRSRMAKRLNGALDSECTRPPSHSRRSHGQQELPQDPWQRKRAQCEARQTRKALRLHAAADSAGTCVRRSVEQPGVLASLIRKRPLVQIQPDPLKPGNDTGRHPVRQIARVAA